ncbi:MAG: DUF3237 domain-containing protein [Pseudomonadota bacterium]
MSEPLLESRWLMKLDMSIAPPSVATPSIVVINVLDGFAEGPNIKARIAGPSGDWARLQDNGNWKIDARLAFVTDDGEPFYCYYNGVIRMENGLSYRIASGETIGRDEIYMRAAPNFETASEKYAWLNNILTVCKVTEFGGGRVAYDVFEIL